MQHWETIDTRTVKGFEIVCAITYEDTHPADHFDDTEEDIAEMCRKIDAGLLSWFVVRVRASKHGIVLGEAYMGGNLYDDARQFVTESDGYYEDLIAEAILSAKLSIEKLTEEVTA